MSLIGGVEYRLEGGVYALYGPRMDASGVLVGEQLVLKTADGRVALAFDCESGALLTHGDPAVVQEWAKTARGLHTTTGRETVADDVILIVGPIPVEDVNQCLATGQYCLKLVHPLLSHEDQPPAGSRPH